MALTISPYKGQGWIDDSTPDLCAETLNAVDAGISANSNAINAIANAVVSQIVNDPDKIASMAALFVVNQQVNTITSNLTWKTLYNGDVTITNGSNITITSGDIGNYKELLVISGSGNNSGWISYHFDNAGAKFVVSNVVSGIGIVNDNVVPFSLRIASSTVFTALLGNNVRIRYIYGR
jgi:hypothetical protein